MCLKFGGIKWSVIEQGPWHCLLGTQCVCTSSYTGAHTSHLHKHTKNKTTAKQNPTAPSLGTRRNVPVYLLHNSLRFCYLVLHTGKLRLGGGISKIKQNLGVLGNFIIFLVSCSSGWHRTRGWPWTLDPPTSTSQVLVLWVCTTPDLSGAGDQTQVFNKQAFQALNWAESPTSSHSRLKALKAYPALLPHC